MSFNKLKEYLDSKGARYVTIQHSPAYTAHDVAAQSHISLSQMAKTVIFKADDKLVMCIVPADYWVDCDKLKELTGARYVELAKEKEFYNRFPFCEVGAMPPFGDLFGMQSFIDERLLANNFIAFNATKHSVVFDMNLATYLDLANPICVNLGTITKHKAA